MNQVSQKKMFLESEGDLWFSRNQLSVEKRKLPDDDVILQEVLDLAKHLNLSESLNILELGCGDGTRLAWLKQNLNANCFGIEPSAKAVAAAQSKGINAIQGVADSIPFPSKSIDILIFGFCLYLCDREDLFRIASEADRVIAQSGWIIILDFFSQVPSAKPYHHLMGIKSYRMDYRNLFTWHPFYECYTHKVRHHIDAGYTDFREEWVSVSVLRKNQSGLNE